MYTEKTAAARAETQPACGEGTGQLPSCGALAFPYVAVQGQDPVRYDDQEALRQGTLFPGLDLPFHRELRSRFPQVDGPLLELYWSYIRLGQEGRKRYQEKCGPLQQTDITPGAYQWLKDPWPWDEKGD